MTDDIAGLLKELCSRASITQAALASSLNVALPTANRWVNGRSKPDNRAMDAIRGYIEGLGNEFGDLLERLEEDGASASADKPKRGRHKSEEEAPAGRAKAKLDVKAMEGLLWKAACAIRGEKDAPKFKDYLLPMVFTKRLSDVFDDEMDRLTEEFGDREVAESVVEDDYKNEDDPRKRVVRFYMPPETRWAVVSGREAFDWPKGEKPKTLGEQLTTTVRRITRANPSLQGVIIVDYNETRNGEREISDEALSRVVEILSDPRHRLGLKDVEPDFLGRAYEYLLRKFAEGQGQSAGEFFTPQEVGWLMAYLMNPQQGEDIYDCCCGSAGLLIKCQLALAEREGKVQRPLKLNGQEMTGSSFAIAHMNMVLHDMSGEIVRGNTMTNPKFLANGKLRQFDVVVTNPMWNQKGFDQSTYDNDPYERFSERGGFAPASSADWAWMQHVLAHMKPEGRAAIVIDTGAASRGSGNEGDNKEKTIRKWFVDQDLVESVILLPDNLFYNTTAAGLIVTLNRNKPKKRKGKILLVNASDQFAKGRPKNYLTDDAIRIVSKAVRDGKDIPGLLKVVDVEDVVGHDYNLSPSRYVVGANTTEQRDIQEILDELYGPKGLEFEARRLDKALTETFSKLGYRIGGRA